MIGEEIWREIDELRVNENRNVIQELRRWFKDATYEQVDSTRTEYCLVIKSPFIIIACTCVFLNVFLSMWKRPPS